MIETREIPRRDEIPAQFTWDLSSVYATDEEWEEDAARLEALGPEIEALQGTLGQGAGALLRALQLSDRVGMSLGCLYSYARMRKDSDGADPAGQALEARAGSLHARISASLSFIEPEILALPPETVTAWQAEEPELAPYAYYLDRLSRRRPHVLSAEAEALIAGFSDITRAPYDAYDALANADLTFPTITDEQGAAVQLSHGRYFTFLTSPDRRVRRDAFRAFLGTFGGVRNTVATTLAATVRDHALEARLRGYPSCVAAAMGPNDIPEQVYHNLVATVEANLPRLHRYVALRKRLMGLDELHPYDLYAPLTVELEDRYDYSGATALAQAAFAPLGAEYGAALREVLESRWIDVYESVGKSSGGYSGGSYTTPPFILLNYQDRLRDVYTLAHELGHSLHSYFTRRAQPYISGRYTTFVAEVASTLNEALLTAHLLKTSDDAALRRRLIVEQLEDIRFTLFRQTMFAEFELEIHQRVEAGEALTAAGLSSQYRALVARYYGSDLALDDEIGMEWSVIPHFYFNFYVYQYATGLAAALMLAQQILEEGEPAVQRYLRFLRSGSARPSIELLRDAGVDMTTPAPIQQAMDRFDALLDQLEAASSQ